MKNLIFLLIMVSVMLISCQSTQETAVSDTYVSTPVVQEEAPRESTTDEQAIASQYKPTSGQLIARMGLSDEQVGAYKSILGKYSKEMSGVRQSNPGNEMAMMNQIRQLQANQDAEIRGVLSGSQYKIYVEAMEHHRSK